MILRLIRRVMAGALIVAVATQVTTRAEQIAPIRDADAASLVARIEAALGDLAEVDPKQAAALLEALRTTPGKGGTAMQRVLDAHCLIEVAINPESRVKVAPGPAEHDLTAGEWRCFLVKVHNIAGVASPLRVSIARPSRSGRDAWLEIELYDGAQLEPELTGDLVEYRVMRLRTDAVGYRAAVIAMDVGQGTADIGFRNDTMITFRCKAP